MAKQHLSKQKAAAKVGKNIAKYLAKIKPKYSVTFTAAIWHRLADFLFGLIAGQSCFLNTIAEHTRHYAGRQRQGRLLRKTAQVGKLSGWLLLPGFSRLLFSYLSYLRRELFPGDGQPVGRRRGKARAMGVKERVFRKRLMLHDGTDIQKSHSKTMEHLCDCRDGSKSTARKAVTGKGYLVEGSVAVRQGRLFPCLLNLYSTAEADHKTEKEETKKNILTLGKNRLLEGFLHVFDRGYDSAAFMAWCLREGVSFLIRANISRNIIRQEEYDRRTGATVTEKIQWQKRMERAKKTIRQKREAMFSPLESLIKRMAFRKHPESRYGWFEIGWEKLYLRGEEFPKYAADVIPVTFVSVRITDREVKGIDEDLCPGGGKEKEKGEREIHLFTTEQVRDIDDAVTLFLCYLLRWKIETFFRWIKQVFGLEKVRIQSFQKIRNLLILLPIAANWLYGRFREFETGEEKGKTILLRTVFQKEDSAKGAGKKRADDTIIAEILFFHCREYCRKKGLTHNPDSFAKSVNELMRHDEAYQRITLAYGFCDSG